MPRRPLRTRQQSAAYLPPALVLDCSVAVAWYLEGEGTDFTDSLLHAIPKLEIWVPALWMLEFSNALFAAERRRRSGQFVRDHRRRQSLSRENHRASRTAPRAVHALTRSAGCAAKQFVNREFFLHPSSSPLRGRLVLSYT